MADKNPPNGLLVRAQVEKRTGLSTSSIYRLMRQQNFPLPIVVGARNVRWIEDEIEEYMRQRPRAAGRAA